VVGSVTGTVVRGIVVVVAGDVVVVDGLEPVVPVVPEGALDPPPSVWTTSCGGVVVSRLPIAMLIVEAVVRAKL
jgi:hypothetical protein